MAAKEQPQPTNVAQPEMPMQPNAYQAYPQYAYEDPNKGKAKMLTLEYALAMGSAIRNSSVVTIKIRCTANRYTASSVVYKCKKI